MFRPFFFYFRKIEKPWPFVLNTTYNHRYNNGFLCDSNSQRKSREQPIYVYPSVIQRYKFPYPTEAKGFSLARESVNQGGAIEQNCSNYTLPEYNN